MPLVRCHPIALQQVWTNLIANSLDAMSGSGRLTIAPGCWIPSGSW
ncbi:hypothetical protein ACSZMV_12725 [Aeromonas veronii]